MTTFTEILDNWDIDIDDQKLACFEKYYELLISWNERFNLTSVTDKEQVYIRHFSDSIALMHYTDIAGKKILDVGSGAGFPGIVLAIMCSTCEIVLLDSLQKRTVFLESVCKELGLYNVKVLWGRAEETGHDTLYRENFDIVTSRAVAGLDVLCEYCIPFVKFGGMFVSYKSGDSDEEEAGAGNAISVLGGCLLKTEKYNLPFTDISRSLIFIEKSSDTPERYPRRAGKPLKKPL